MPKTVTGGVQARGIHISAHINAGPMTAACGSGNPDACDVGCSGWVDCAPTGTVLNTWGVSPEVA